MRSTYIFLLILGFLTNCKNHNNDSQLYLGAYRSIDQVIPYPFVLEQKADSIYLYDNQGVLLDQIKKINIRQKDTLKFAGRHLLIGEKGRNYFDAFDLKDTKKFDLNNVRPNSKSRARFEMITLKNDINSKDFPKIIDGSIWKYEVLADDNSNPNRDLRKEQLLHFTKDSLYVLTQYFYKGTMMSSEYETKGYTIFQIDERSFLSFEKKKDNPQPIFQIANFSVNNIELIDFSSTDVKTIQFIKENTKIADYFKILENSPSYSNCFDGFQGEYYYGDDVVFKKGNKYLLDLVKYNDPKVYDQSSGYIIVHFNVNCLGEIGHYGLIQMNKIFEPNSFSKELIGHIFNKMKGLKDWTPTSSSIDWLPYKDVHAFLMFKIENGKITEVLP